MKLTLHAVFCFLLVVCSYSTYAHSGGHYHKGDGTVYNIWQLKNGQQVKGNFSMGNADFIVLEQEEGKLVQLSLDNLSTQDQQLARFKIKSFNRLNKEDLSEAKMPTPIKNTFNYNLLILCTLFLLIAIIVLKQNTLLNGGSKAMVMACSLSLVLIIVDACKKSGDAVSTIAIPKTSVNFLDSAFAPYKPSITSTKSDNTYFYVSSTGLPNHNMMVGITNWQQQVPISQPYTGSNNWSIPLQPVYADVPLSTKTNFLKGAIAIAVNGIPIFNALNNRGEDSYVIGELDNWGGHCGKADDYHYHAAPLHLSTTSGLKPIAFALDGFAVYNNEPDGATMEALDSCHGHIYKNGVYHYHVTSTYPYVIGAMRGRVALDANALAPENFIIPQASTSAVRPPTNPLNGAIITGFTAVGTNGYQLIYKIGTQQGLVEYSWDAANKYTYKTTSVNGLVTTNVYQR